MKSPRSLRTFVLVVATTLSISTTLPAQHLTHTLSPADGVSGDFFSHAIALSGERALIGTYVHSHTGSFVGAAYVFDMTSGQELLELGASDGASGDSFGLSVATDGVRALVGANSGPVSLGRGSAYIFDLASGQELHKLYPSDGVAGDSYGGALAIAGPYAVIGAPQANMAQSPPGAIYVYDTASGQQLFKLFPSDSTASDRFGWSVAISGDKAIVGAYRPLAGGTFSGTAYIFDLATGNELHKLTPSKSSGGVYFGYSVAIDDNRAVVGAPESNVAFVFDVATGNLLRALTAPDSSAGDYFGTSVGISGSRAVVGALRDDDNGFDSGSAYLFNIGTGGLLGKMLASNGTMNDLFAKDVAIDGDSILIGALFHDVPTTDAGTAFVFSVRPDCNENGIPDARDIAVGTSSDNDGDGIPDECGTTSAYCFGDGSGQPCPCGNSGATGEGCLNSGNQGGLAFTVGSTRVSADDLLIAASRLIPGQPAILFSGMHSLNGGAGLPFGDGLRCVGGSVRRLGVRLPDSAGTALWGPGLAASGGWGPGDSRYLQCWYSDPQGPCGSTVNLSNGVSVTLQP